MQVANLALDNFQHHLRVRPKITNSISGGTIGFIGDVLAQFIEQWNQPEFAWNQKRSGKIMVFGFLMGTPSTWWFQLMERSFSSDRTWSVVTKKCLVQQSVWAPIAAASFFSYITIIQHHREGYTKVKQEVKRVLHIKLLHTLVVSSCFWPPLQAINFMFVPIPLRVVWNNFWLAGWNCFMSTVGHKKN